MDGMTFLGGEVPQADKIWDVAALVDAVSSGADGDIALGAAIGKSARQGRYYRLAAESIGLLEPVIGGHSELSEEGENLVAAQQSPQRRNILIAAVLSSRFFRALLGFIESAGSNGRTKAQIVEWMGRNTTLSGSTTWRRYSTVRAWLEDLDLVTGAPDGTLFAAAYDVSFIDVQDDPYQPMPVGRRALMPFNGSPPVPKTDVDSETIQYWVDRATLERATQKHEEIVARAARLARDAGHDVSMNQFVDLFASGASGSYLFEMKSNNHSNTISQVRKAVSQLYEYQYQQALESSRLVVALEAEPIESAAWTVEYLVNARGILPVWENGDSFSGPAASRDRLPWLMV